MKSGFTFIFCLIASMCFSQLSDFNLSVTATDETCSGNGAIEMTVSNTTSGATIIYNLYLLPDTTAPIAQTSENAFNGLEAGDYLVEAIQVLGSEENIQQQNVTIENLFSELDFELSGSAGCESMGSITVNVTSGTAEFYEIFSGPVTVPPQTGNTFTDLPTGSYLVRVYDPCGNALAKTYSLFPPNNDLDISSTTLPAVYTSCDEVTVISTLTAEENFPLIYPLTITYTVTPSSGTPVETYTQTVTEGDLSEIEISTIVTLYDDLPFEVSILVEDTCGNQFTSEELLDPAPTILLSDIVNEVCGSYIKLFVNGFMPPYTVSFDEYPDDFDPVASNSNYPGPYTETSITFGDTDMSVPIGDYTLTLTDACGRSSTASITVEDLNEDPDPPIVNAGNNTCDPSTGELSISIADKDVVSVVFISAPDPFEFELPYDASELIDGGIYLNYDLPIGDYIILVTDNCGYEHYVEVTIPEFVQMDIFSFSTPSCDTGSGTLRISSPYGFLTSIIITAAPADFTEPLPYDYSAAITSGGVFYVGSLPSGFYAFEAIDECGYEYTAGATVESYYPNPNAYILDKNCGSFDVGINDTDESVTNRSWWFQKYFPESNAWGHPYSGVTYTEGDVPNENNAIEIENESMIYNIFLIGEFRIIKVFQPYNNIDPSYFCMDILGSFTITSELVINDVFDLNCGNMGSTNDVYFDVLGVEPFNFSITAPYVYDNGTSNIFYDLDPGIYEFKIEDACGSIKNTTINLENLAPLARANTPDNIVECVNDGSSNATFDLSTQNGQILGGQNPDDYTITYHLSQSDADTGDNPLPYLYTNNSSPQTVYARVAHNTLDFCPATTSFEITVGTVPQLSPDEFISICEGGSVLLTADPGYSAYEWSTGATTNAIAITDSGTYTVSVKNEYDNFYCEAIKTFTVVSSSIATIENIETTDWSSTDNSITVYVSGIGDYQYSLDGINYQDSNSFTNLEPGAYTVYVMDLNGCGVVSEEAFLLNYPKFFTPNGDGHNDLWRINFAANEPKIEIIIFDRYGKLITSFGSQDYGWDGTYNGHNMPSSDYWFVVNRADGTTHRGHFTLKR
ncbi:T9SS type B sorting domain-containing protein [Mangrovimonas sp. TPBH4]|uniref:T9SS type B sorting domain-containing protein n=1 Tax=Mangrovimonas sp. TPBH4 TaxID=1645914 RepID=UPI0018D18614|nr:T9SS type B sorting domain-containing protein [Mangrovimonas sp. TPBH4]